MPIIRVERSEGRLRFGEEDTPAPFGVIPEGVRPEIIVAVARGGLIVGGGLAYALGVKLADAMKHYGIGHRLRVLEVAGGEHGREVEAVGGDGVGAAEVAGDVAGAAADVEDAAATWLAAPVGTFIALPSRDCYQDQLGAFHLQIAMLVHPGAYGGPLVDLAGDVGHLFEHCKLGFAGEQHAKHRVTTIQMRGDRKSVV